jgi:hypothetical protein
MSEMTRNEAVEVVKAGLKADIEKFLLNIVKDVDVMETTIIIHPADKQTYNQRTEDIKHCARMTAITLDKLLKLMNEED